MKGSTSGFRPGRVAIVAMAGFCLSSPPVSGGIPVHDPANLAGRLQATLERAAQWAAEKRWMRSGRDLTMALALDQTKTANAGFVSMIGHEAEMRLHQHRMELRERGAPDRDACDTVWTSENLGAARAEAAVVTPAEVRLSFTERQSRMYENTEGEQALHRQSKIDEMINACAEADIDCLHAEHLLAGGETGVVAGNDLESARRQIDLLVAPVPVGVPDRRRDEGTAVREDRVRHMRRTALQSLAAESMAQVLSNYAATEAAGGHSPISLMRSFVESRFGSTAPGAGRDSSSFLLRVANAHGPDKRGETNGGEVDANGNPVGDPTGPYEVIRKQAAMDAFLVNMRVLSHEQRLRMEMLMAAQLSLMVDPLE